MEGGSMSEEIRRIGVFQEPKNRVEALSRLNNLSGKLSIMNHRFRKNHLENSNCSINIDDIIKRQLLRSEINQLLAWLSEHLPN